MSVLARSAYGAIQERWISLGVNPVFKMLRGPETGLIMVRGRVGGTGEAFNVGEATVTRASVSLEGGAVGHSTALGRDGAKARLCAVIDALAQGMAMGKAIDAGIIDPLERALQQQDEKRKQETAATKVDFFTMVRGED